MQVIKTLQKYSLSLLDNMPYKVHILLTALYIWTWIFFQLNKLTGFILESIIKYAPDYLLPNYTLSGTNPKIPIKVIRAFSANHQDITKRLKFFMNLKWDPDMCDYKGGVDLDTFSQYIESGIIYIAYVFDYQINLNTLDKFLDLIETAEENGGDYDSDDELASFKQYVNIAIINIGKKIVTKLKNGKLENEDILFGELNLH